MIDGVEFVEQLQVVDIDGGVAPERGARPSAVARSTTEWRPIERKDEAVAWLVGFLGDVIEDGDTFESVDWAPSRRRAMTNERLASLVALTGAAPAGQSRLDRRRDVRGTGDSGDELWCRAILCWLTEATSS